ncbi:MAG: lamin tail domain-containing protein [Candidatus Aenigmarchaeota archaeon]|nr:lamin tail domain-containing protein [Candidatus Aenigmarchaeota archaeon]
MKYIILCLLLIVLVSGCIYPITGQSINKEKIREELKGVMEKMNNTIPDKEEKIPEEPKNATEVQVEETLKCPICNDDNSCTNDYCSETTNFECVYEEISCQNTIATCPDGFEMTCENICMDGVCTICIPDCIGHRTPQTEEPCIESWSCSDWSECTNGTKNRECSENNCETEENRPEEFQTCVEQPRINYIESGKGREKLDEWIELIGHGVDLTNWTIADAANHRFTFPSIEITENLKVHTGPGENNSTDLFWGYGSPIWNNNGDNATLKDSNGNVVDIYTYSE